MKVAVTFVTCDRIAYSARVLETFAQHNDLSAFDLIHADDASTETDIFPLVERYGFSTLARSTERQGAQRTRTAITEAAAERGADWILMLENDWEWARPFPWALLEYCADRGDVYNLRLLGQFKEIGPDGQPRRPFFTRHMGLPGRPVTKWTRLTDAPEPAEMGSIHFGSPPNVCRTKEAVWLQSGMDCDQAVARKSGELHPLQVVRPIENVCWHIGAERTPHFKL